MDHQQWENKNVLILFNEKVTKLRVKVLSGEQLAMSVEAYEANKCNSKRWVWECNWKVSKLHRKQWHQHRAQNPTQCVLAAPSPGSSPSSVGDFSQKHALQLPDPAFLWQHQTLLCSFLFLQQMFNVAGGAQQDVASSLHGEDGPSQSLPKSTAQREKESGHK